MRNLTSYHLQHKIQQYLQRKQTFSRLNKSIIWQLFNTILHHCKTNFQSGESYTFSFNCRNISFLYCVPGCFCARVWRRRRLQKTWVHYHSLLNLCGLISLCKYYNFQNYHFLSADINECQRDNACHSEAMCINLAGSYTCTCKDGYKGDGFYCTGECY